MRTFTNDILIEKWADYLISAVRYKGNYKRKAVDYFKIHTDNGDSVSSAVTWSCEEVINELKKGKTFSTIIKEGSSRWKKGGGVSLPGINKLSLPAAEEVHIEEYVGELPEF